ncbi:GNAT family N-acetyltransferase [Paenibacillus sp. FSL P2-0136]|uniref:GNAT family N-acetyltransferase n=1 Tax=Paenibacillus sp. FSL P2-0136 TaxID=2975317 RepID=UPI0030DB5F4B
MILEQSRGYQIRLMDEQAAREIVNWRYETPYALYNMLDAADDAEDIEELLDGSYFSVAAADGALIGFFCYGQNAQVGEGIESGLYLDGTSLDIGLGLRPDLTGQGRGLAFLQAGMKFAERTYDAKRFRLSVAAFNLRAVSVYKKAGFVLLHSFVHQHGDSEMEFLLMETRDIAARL